MRKTYIPLFTYLLVFLVFTSFSNARGGRPGAPATVDSLSSPAPLPTVSAAAALYDQMQLDAAGLDSVVFEHALKGYERLKEQGLVQNERYLSIVDMSQGSRAKRFYLLDMQEGELDVNTYVSHGKNSGLDRAERFSNIPESEQSSLGFYLTKHTYTGKHGLSLRLSGMEAGFNDKAEASAIVVHGAAYVNAGRVQSAYMGRSQGCPALPDDVAPEVIRTIKDGSVLFVYHPTESYLQGSPLLQDPA